MRSAKIPLSSDASAAPPTFVTSRARLLLTAAAALPVGAALLDPPHLDAFEGPLGAHCHVDVTVFVEVEALAGGGAFGSHRPAGVENPHLGRT